MNPYKLKVKIDDKTMDITTSGKNKDEAIDTIKRNVIGAEVVECGEFVVMSQCPDCGGVLFVDNHCTASDHPETTVQFFICTECDWESDHYLMSDVLISQIAQIEARTAL